MSHKKAVKEPLVPKRRKKYKSTKQVEAPKKRSLILGDVKPLTSKEFKSAFENIFSNKEAENFNGHLTEKDPIPQIKKEDMMAVTVKELKDLIAPLAEAYEGLQDAFYQERYRRSLLQTYVGEAVMDELLHQSYGRPEYTTEESLKRLISVVLKATTDHREKPEYNLKPISEVMNLWSKPEDPHLLPSVDADTEIVKLTDLLHKTVNLSDLWPRTGSNEKTQMALNCGLLKDTKETLEKQEDLKGQPGVLKQIYSFSDDMGNMHRKTKFVRKDSPAKVKKVSKKSIVKLSLKPRKTK